MACSRSGLAAFPRAAEARKGHGPEFEPRPLGARRELAAQPGQQHRARLDAGNGWIIATSFPICSEESDGRDPSLRPGR